MSGMCLVKIASFSIAGFFLMKNEVLGCLKYIVVHMPVSAGTGHGQNQQFQHV
jgi:hypothetical protein